MCYIGATLALSLVWPYPAQALECDSHYSLIFDDQEPPLAELLTGKYYRPSKKIISRLIADGESQSDIDEEALSTWDVLRLKFRSRRKKQVPAFLETYVEERQKSSRGLIQAAWLYFSLKRYEKVLPLLEKAFGMDPNALYQSAGTMKLLLEYKAHRDRRHGRRVLPMRAPDLAKGEMSTFGSYLLQHHPDRSEKKRLKKNAQGHLWEALKCHPRSLLILEGLGDLLSVSSNKKIAAEAYLRSGALTASLWSREQYGLLAKNTLGADKVAFLKFKKAYRLRVKETRKWVKKMQLKEKKWLKRGRM
jgi:tetratricopeptide (TPR) repeat protein